ncbi:MAG: NAD-glutamate dehydrogenase domain-containing protein [Bacteroidota bacterium]|jgi:glutamate dehydrogenase
MKHSERKHTDSKTSDNIISKVTSQANKICKADRNGLAIFVRNYLKRVNARYIRNSASNDETENIVNLIKFLVNRKSDEIKVNIQPTHTSGKYVLQTCMTDQRFIIDTIKLCIEQEKLGNDGVVHFSLPIKRDKQNNLVSFSEREDAEHRLESISRFLISGFQDELQAEDFSKKIARHLRMAKNSVNDYSNTTSYIKKQIERFASSSVKNEIIANEALKWLMEDNFILLSLTETELNNSFKKRKSLGVELGQIGSSDAYKFIFNDFLKENEKNGITFKLFKTPFQSPVKNSGLINLVLIADKNQNILIVVAGMFTRKGLSQQRSSIPLLKERLNKIITEDEARLHSSTWNARVKAFNSTKIEYLFEATDSELRENIDKRLDMESNDEATAHVDIIPSRKSAYVLVGIPHDAFTDDLVDHLTEKLKNEFKAQQTEIDQEAARGQTIPVAFYFSDCEIKDKSMEKNIEKQVVEICTPWQTNFRNALEKSGNKNWNLIYADFAEAFPTNYEMSTSISEVLNDLQHLENLGSSDKPKFDILSGDNNDEVRLKMYRKDGTLMLLSEILPILHNVGFKVLDQTPVKVNAANGNVYHIDTFRILSGKSVGEVDFIKDKSRIIEGLDYIFQNKVPADALNKLLLRPGLNWLDIDILRSYARYSIQLGPFFDFGITDKILYKHAEITIALIDYFHAKFNPEKNKSLQTRISGYEEKRSNLLKLLDKIHDASEDRMFRVFINFIDATLRTNAFKKVKPFHYLSFKFECSKFDKCPEPRPMFEIFVHHAEMEGVHLRSGRVARGGLRWSDRMDDYRTEIFGLMRAQKTKNVLIVPQGAKGGFIAKGNPKPGQDRKAYGDEMYKVLIRGMLDITDNRSGGKEVRPAEVVCHDEFDPYLVVAADKGTAHLSDTANALSAEYGFWLGDAFASGGSVGYDHKVEGITAKGAWVCVKHHFSKVNIDPEKDVIRVVGIGDMSGDVFGNGMLRSKTIKLVGAFNHAHVFLDPNPDIAKSYEERDRMFKLPRSGWNDYDTKTISKGGGIFSRTEKSIKLTPETQAMLGTTEKSLPTEEVIKRLLTLDVDLLYNGGLGTYIKASSEDHREVGDKSNDAVRVDGKDVRAKVVGEGGNLGVTQKGRIEFALKGGLIDTDAIDNSGGVDCSDREVNLKILFGPLVNKGKMKMEERNKVLKNATNEVLDKILNDNYGHALCLTLDEIRSKKDPYLFLWTSEFLHEKGIMTPSREDLPTLNDLKTRGIQNGLTRPELSKLMAFFKLYSKTELLGLDASKFPLKEEFLEFYFPAKVYKGFKEAINNHMLLKEILATVWIGNIINNAGASLYTDLINDTDRSVMDISFAYTTAERWMRAHELKKNIMESKNAPVENRFRAFVSVEEKIKNCASWLLHFYPGESLYKALGNIQDFSNDAKQYHSVLVEITKLNSSTVKTNTEKITSQGFSKDVAVSIANSEHWTDALAVYKLSKITKKNLSSCAEAYFQSGSITGISMIMSHLTSQAATDKFEAQAVKSLYASIRRTSLSLAEKVCRGGIDKTLKKEPALALIGSEVNQSVANADGAVSIPLLVVVNEKLHKVIERL